MANYNALNVPPEASRDGGDELARIAISRQTGPSMSLRRGFDDPEAWGRLLADVVKHMSQIYALETKYNRESAAKRIVEAFAKEMATGPDDSVPSIAKR